MRSPVARALRWFVGLSLLVGGIALATGAMILQDSAMQKPVSEQCAH